MNFCTRRSIAWCYRRFVASAEKALARGDSDGAMRRAAVGAKFAYEFNSFLRDEAMEALVASLATTLLGTETTEVPRMPQRIAFYDAFGLDNKVLAQQYIRAIGASDVECLYLYEENPRVDGGEVEAELKDYSNITVLKLAANLSPSARVRTAFRAVQDFGASKLFLQLCPWSIEAAVVVCALCEVTRYIINLQDHAFSIGCSYVDFSIEFRDYGASISTQMRDMAVEKLLMLPYYPILRRSTFVGFPPQAEGKTVIFSGGAAYKVYGENDAFFKLAKRLLLENPDAVLLFACGGKAKHIRNFIRREGLQERFILLGHRRDICEVYEHSDIFLSTYPFFGGLMSQYAAVYGKPILAYTDPKFRCNRIEDFVCHSRELQITYRAQEPFFEYARRLCSDASLRAAEGAKLTDSLITPAHFNTEFRRILAGDATTFPLHVDCSLGWAAVVDNLLLAKKPALMVRYWVKVARCLIGWC